jgi:hypothetical protein
VRATYAHTEEYSPVTPLDNRSGAVANDPTPTPEPCHEASGQPKRAHTHTHISKARREDAHTTRVSRANSARAHVEHAQQGHHAGHAPRVWVACRHAARTPSHTGPACRPPPCLVDPHPVVPASEPHERDKGMGDMGTQPRQTTEVQQAAGEARVR